MNDIALKKFGVDPFVVVPQPEDRESASYLARLAAARRFKAKNGEIVSIDAIETFSTFLEAKASRNREEVTPPVIAREELEGASEATIDLAERFLAAWPVNLAAPEVSAEPDGEIAFDWSGHDGRNFSVSLREDARLAYAGAYGEGKTKYGTDRFENKIPSEIVEAVRELRG